MASSADVNYRRAGEDGGGISTLAFLSLDSNVTLNLNSTVELLTTPAAARRGFEQYRLYDVAVGMNAYYLWLVFALGFPGNLLSLLTIVRMPSVSSSKMHVALLAIVDNLAIVAKLLYHQLTAHKLHLSHAGCKVSLLACFY